MLRAALLIVSLSLTAGHAFAQDRSQAPTAACPLSMAPTPGPGGSGFVLEFLDLQSAQALLADTEAKLGAPIDPAYRDDQRVEIETNSGEVTALVPAGMTVTRNQRVDYQGAYRSSGMPCGYVPNLVTDVIRSLAIPRPAGATDPKSVAQAAAQMISHGGLPVAGLVKVEFGASASDPNSWTVATFYRVTDPKGGDAYWAVRRATGGQAANTAGVVSWADSRTCPAITPALTAAAALRPPPLPTKIVTDGPPPRPALPGNYFDLWGANAFGDPVNAIGGGQALPIAGWWAQAEDAMQPCWSGQEPAI